MRVQNFAKLAPNNESDDRHFGQAAISEQKQIFNFQKAGQNIAHNLTVALHDRLCGQLVLELEHEACFDVLEDARGAGLFKILNIGVKLVVQLINEKYWSAPDTIWLPTK